MWSFQEICLLYTHYRRIISVLRWFVLMGCHVCAMDKVTNKSNEGRLFRVDSEYICIKPRVNKKKLLIKICVSS